ncbi:hypothetical protein [Glaciecola sp. SC05]|uniref:hypothetical protein n=1 Tax=Glaciecola sp. SC05 TaxID=1987355 RepID=UPI0035279AF5
MDAEPPIKAIRYNFGFMPDSNPNQNKPKNIEKYSPVLPTKKVDNRINSEPPM